MLMDSERALNYNPAGAGRFLKCYKNPLLKIFWHVDFLFLEIFKKQNLRMQ